MIGEEDLSSDEEEPVGVSRSRPSHLWISRKDQQDLKDFQVCRTALLLFLPTVKSRVGVKHLGLKFKASLSTN